MHKAIYSAFKDRPDALIKAVAYAAAAPEGTTEEQVVGAIQEQLDIADQQALIDENAGLKAKVAELEAKVAELSPEAAKVEELSKKVSEQETQLAEFSKRTARFGVRPLNVGKPAAEVVASTCSPAEFSAKSPSEKMKFSREGGRIVE